MSERVRRLAPIFWLWLWGLLPALVSVTPVAAQDVARLRVITGYASPFVKPPGTPVSGYSIEVWQEVARRLGVETTWTVLPDLSQAAQLEAVAQARADVAISALAITAERDMAVDFSVPYFQSGLQVLVATGHENEAWWVAILALAPGELLGLLAAGGAIMLLLAHVLWLAERRHNPLFQRGYMSGIGEGVWGLLEIVASGSHGAPERTRPIKRFVVGAMWLSGVVLIAQFTASITAALTIDQLRPGITGPSDLPGKRVATAPGTIAAAWLEARGQPFVPLTDTEQAYGMLVRGEIDAVVYEAAQLRHWLANRGRSMAALVGPVFQPRPYAIAVPLGSPLRKRINRALLDMQSDGTQEEMQRRWFGSQ
jgi:ABC-type amino acid transport substrate-binding protein